MAIDLSNTADIIDSRDVIERITELDALDERSEEEEEELTALRALAEEGERVPDWEHGVALIRDSYFERYAEELADEIGAIDRKATWPLNHIDWTAAADELKGDYTEIDFDGAAYWVR